MNAVTNVYFHAENFRQFADQQRERAWDDYKNSVEQKMREALSSGRYWVRIEQRYHDKIRAWLQPLGFEVVVSPSYIEIHWSDNPWNVQVVQVCTN